VSSRIVALGSPRALRVVAGPAGVPHAVVIDGRRRLVTAVREDWLVQDRWWTEEPVDRHYFELVVEPGRRLVVFRDERRGVWLTHDGVAPERATGRIPRDPARARYALPDAATR
jgi:hypothetical protein